MSGQYVIHYSGNFTFNVNAQNEHEAKQEANKQFSAWLSENAFASDFDSKITNITEEEQEAFVNAYDIVQTYMANPAILVEIIKNLILKSEGKDC